MPSPALKEEEESVKPVAARWHVCNGSVTLALRCIPRHFLDATCLVAEALNLDESWKMFFIDDQIFHHISPVLVNSVMEPLVQTVSQTVCLNVG